MAQSKGPTLDLISGLDPRVVHSSPPLWGSALDMETI